MNELLLAVVIFLITYAIIVTERMDRTVAALLGGMAMIHFIGSYDQETAFHAIDLNVILLLAGMMIIANIISETGLFQWMAVRAVKLGRGHPMRIMQILALVTAVGSAVLDNVTVVVLVAPVTLFVASSLNVSPVPLLIGEVLASNIGGAATLIGDPPNILIGSAAEIDFATFLANMGPLIIVALLLFVLFLPLLFRGSLHASEDARERAAAMDDSGLITNRVLLRQSLIVLGLVLLGFMFHGSLHIGTATVALSGAAILLFWTGREPHRVLRDVEWPTLFFFIGLFILVEALVHVQAIAAAARWVLDITGGNLPLTATALLWVSGISSGIVDNIPYTTTLIPLIRSLGEGGLEMDPLWWALAMGADLGGNATLIGASANVVVASFAERSGHRITFMHFLFYGAITTFFTLLLSTAYLWLRYL